MEKFRAEKDKMPAEKRTLVLTHFPRLKKLMIAKSKLNQVCYTTNDYEIVIKD